MDAVAGRRYLSRTLSAAVVCGALAVTAGQVSGLGPALALPLFLGLQQFGLAWGRGARLGTYQTVTLAVTAAAVGAALQWVLSGYQRAA